MLNLSFKLSSWFSAGLPPPLSLTYFFYKNPMVGRYRHEISGHLWTLHLPELTTLPITNVALYQLGRDPRLLQWPEPGNQRALSLVLRRNNCHSKPLFKKRWKFLTKDTKEQTFITNIMLWSQERAKCEKGLERTGLYSNDHPFHFC